MVTNQNLCPVCGESQNDGEIVQRATGQRLHTSRDCERHINRQLGKVRCPECGRMVIPWDQFPEHLRAMVSCSYGVISYGKEDDIPESNSPMESQGGF